MMIKSAIWPILALMILMMSSLTVAEEYDQEYDDDYGEGAEKAFEIDGLVGLLSDYRENGISLTGNDGALIGNLRLTHKTGLYADMFIANMDSRFGDDLIIDGTVGYNWQGDRYDYGVSFSTKSFHGGLLGSRYFPEVKGTIARDFGIVYAKAGLEYAFDGRWFTGGNEAVYSSLDLEIPVPNNPDFTILSHVGYDFISGGTNAFDYQIGLSAFYKDVELTIMYEESSLNLTDASGGIVFGLKWYF